MTSKHTVRAAACALILASFLPSLAVAQVIDPAARRIDAFDHALLSATRAHDLPGRIAVLTPAVAEVFNASAMAQFIVGPRWTGLQTADRAAISAALQRYMTARLAHDLADSHGPTFTIDPNVQSRGPDKLVHTLVADPNETPDRLDYRMRQYGGAWKIVDLYYNGVSELTTERADLASTLATGGTAALIARIDAATAQQR